MTLAAQSALWLRAIRFLLSGRHVLNADELEARAERYGEE